MKRAPAHVALLAEGVDRNLTAGIDTQDDRMVALLAEGVDRNIQCHAAPPCACGVALLAEGVDRNSHKHRYGFPSLVALLAEGVDRNITTTLARTGVSGRPPRGGRG